MILLRKLFGLALLYTISGAALPAIGQISYDAHARVFRLDGSGSTYAFGVNETGALQPLYWGGRLGANDHLAAAHSLPGHASFDLPSGSTPQEFAGWGAGLYFEPALKVTFPDGNRDLVLHYIAHALEGNTLQVRLKDIDRAVEVTLNYTLDPATGIVGRSARITNGTAQPFVIEQAAAAQFALPPGPDYTLTYMTGRWAGENQVQHEMLRQGARLLESRRGSTGQQNDPWFAISSGAAREEHGEVWYGALAWSGSWRITIERDTLNLVRVTGGYNPFDFGYQLKPGESLTTPVFYAGYTAGGMGGASRALHAFELAHVLPEGPHPRPRPVLYNSWEATGFGVDEAGQELLAEKAASIGVERFVMDDGWFGQRRDDHAGLGDWYVNPQKFPHGLKPLIDKVHALGMDFGLWVEPEMVNPDSDLYRKHPDWVLNFPGRPRTEGRNQLVLNLARQDVRDYVFGFLNRLVNDNDIAFLKWDYNRNWSEPGWPAAGPENEKQVYVKYVENLYSILGELRRSHPKLEIESCSGGGGRVDLGILRYADEVWPSDNTDPYDRLSIQNGFTHAYTPGIMMAWVTDSPNWVNNRTTSLEYRFLSSMQGSLGVGANLKNWNADDFATAKRLIGEYKDVRETVQHGRLYRLVSPAEDSEHSVTESVAEDGSQAVVFAFLHSSTMLYPFPRIRLEGLAPQAQYTIHWIAGEPKQAGEGLLQTPATASGAWWMSHGVQLLLRGDFQAAAFRLDRHS